MNISIKASGFELVPGTRALIEDKLLSLEKHLGEHAGTALLACEVEESIAAVRAGAKYRAEGTLRTNGETYRAEALAETLEGAVDRVRDELAREARGARGKSRGLLKRGGQRVKQWLRGG